jgi:FkbM family methyltransferase
MHQNLLQQATLAVRRPDLLMRKLRGKEVTGIGLEEIARFLGDAPVILEAGALNGSDTVRMAMHWPASTIYAFEPIPAAYDEVRRRTMHLPQVSIHQVALADHSGSAEMHVSANAEGGYRPDSSSLLAPTGHLAEYPHVTFIETITVETLTMADWASSKGVDRIDFMWLDMQGMELSTLQASPQVLAKTSAVLMEVTKQHMYEGDPLYGEVLAWMSTQGFRAAIDRVTLRDGNVLFVRVI